MIRWFLCILFMIPNFQSGSCVLPRRTTRLLCCGGLASEPLRIYAVSYAFWHDFVFLSCPSRAALSNSEHASSPQNLTNTGSLLLHSSRCLWWTKSDLLWLDKIGARLRGQVWGSHFCPLVFPVLIFPSFWRKKWQLGGACRCFPLSHCMIILSVQTFLAFLPSLFAFK